MITEQPEVCERLLLSGCDAALVDDSGDTALHIACRRGDLHCFSVLTQNCPSEQLKGVMAACNYHGEMAELVACSFQMSRVRPFLVSVFHLKGYGQGREILKNVHYVVGRIFLHAMTFNLSFGISIL